MDGKFEDWAKVAGMTDLTGPEGSVHLLEMNHQSGAARWAAFPFGQVKRINRRKNQTHSTSPANRLQQRIHCP